MIDVINYPGTLPDIENSGLIYVYVRCKNTGSTINAKLQTCYDIGSAGTVVNFKQLEYKNRDKTFII